jgi:hypothetical protein
MKKKELLSMIVNYFPIPSGRVTIEYKNSKKLFAHVRKALKAKTVSKEAVAEYLRDLKVKSLVG